jgi:hypothetical protein
VSENRRAGCTNAQHLAIVELLAAHERVALLELEPEKVGGVDELRLRRLRQQRVHAAGRDPVAIPPGQPAPRHRHRRGLFRGALFLFFGGLQKVVFEFAPPGSVTVTPSTVSGLRTK